MNNFEIILFLYFHSLGKMLHLGSKKAPGFSCSLSASHDSTVSHVFFCVVFFPHEPLSHHHPRLPFHFPSFLSPLCLSGGCQRPEVADAGNIPPVRGGLHHRSPPERQEEEVRHQVEEQQLGS